MRSHAKNLATALARFLAALTRPSKATNTRLLHARGETLQSLAIRQSTPTDRPALAALHVKTWADTYPCVRRPPSYELREHQWREQFKVTDGTWFCFVVTNHKGDLVGFAKGKLDPAAPDSPGLLDKIYLLRDYQRLGLGRRLVGHVARAFLSRGVRSMTLFGVPQNPSCAFHEALGAQRLLAPSGQFDGGYRWPDLQTLASICPV